MTTIQTDYSVKRDRTSRIVTLPDGKTRRTALKIPPSAGGADGCVVVFNAEKREKRSCGEV